MNPNLLLSDFDMTQDDHKRSVDRVVSIAMYDLAEQLERGTIATLISGCRLGAIDAMQAAKPELAAIFIRLGAELMATAGDDVVIECGINNPSKAIALISAIA